MRRKNVAILRCVCITYNMVQIPKVITYYFYLPKHKTFAYRRRYSNAKELTASAFVWSFEFEASLEAHVVSGTSSSLQQLLTAACASCVPTNEQQH